MQNVLFVISGPAGVGKGTLVKLLLEQDSSLALSVSCTTRSPRAGEENGKHYFFIGKEEFLRRIEEQDFLEYDEHFGNLYGTPKSFVLEQLKTKSVVLEIDVVGALNVRRAFQEVRTVLIMVVPPDLKELERRLTERGSESAEARKARLDRVRYELAQQEQYDYVVVNDDLQTAKRALQDIIQKEKNCNL